MNERLISILSQTTKAYQTTLALMLLRKHFHGRTGFFIMPMIVHEP